MKAVEYAKRFNESGNASEAFKEILLDFVNEVFTLKEERRAKTDSACIAILNELDRKWIKFTELIEAPDNKNSFRDVLLNADQTKQLTKHWNPRNVNQAKENIT